MRIRHDIVQVYVVRRVAAGDEFLQLLRVDGDYMGGTWQTVSGGVEEGEPAWQAALRELREEAGLAAQELYRLDRVNSFYTDGDETVYHALPFCAIVDAGAQVTMDREHTAFRWVAREKAGESFMWPGDHACIAQIQDYILAGRIAKEHMRIRL
jgi:dihydroneopterin triphosphate diphosphatase